MQAVYVLANENEFLISKKIDELIKNKTDYEIIKYDMRETSLERVVEDLDTYNFLANHKLIIASNCLFLTSEGNASEDYSVFEKYLDHPNLDNILILTCNKLDERRKLVKKVLKVAVRETFDINPIKLIKDHLGDYQMSDKVVNYLLEYCHTNYEKIVHELEKLKLYCYDTKNITEADIDDVVTQTIDEDIFGLVEAIVTKEKAKAFKIYEELLSHNEEPMKILILVANQFRLLYQVKVLSKDKLHEEEIATQLGIHPYRVKLAKQKAMGYSEQELVNYILKLADLDYEIKHGTTFKNVGFELFILNL